MMNIDMNTEMLDKGLSHLDAKVNLKTITNILAKGASILRRSARQELKHILLSRTKHYYIARKSIKSYDVLNGVRITKYKKRNIKKNSSVVGTHIMGDYRLKWFEKQTKKRYTRKGYYRGKIWNDSNQAKAWFFKKANQKSLGKAQAKIQDEFKKILKFEK